MTENRFDIIELEEESYPMILFLDNGKEMTDTNVVDCLNGLHEENKRLQGRIQEYEEVIGGYIDENEEIRKKVNALHEKNEQLKQTIETQNFNYKNAKGIIHSSEHQIQRLQDENEQIKEKNKELDGKYVDEFSLRETLQQELRRVENENEQLKAQLYCDNEEGICNICKYHYLVSDDEVELGYYNSRCKKGHYECARISLKHCEDFEKEDD